MLQTLRSILFQYLALPVWTITICTIGLPTLFMPKRFAMNWIIKPWIIGGKWLEENLVGLRYEVIGLEHLPAQGPYLVAAKHQSTYETFKIHEIFNDPAIILKKSLLNIPWWGWFLAKSGVIAIDRSSPQQAIKSVNEGALRVKDEGRPLIIFPQGTRVQPGASVEDFPYKPGIARIQDTTQLPVIPMRVNSGEFWPKGAITIKPGTVTFEFLPAIDPGLDRAALMEKLEELLEG